ncbi:MAG: TldD/PmbA family protein [Candidatus Rokubacteria bacterium]|nr:TldD/PmbA family protein [Candidatus Rokubacteria bacterium]
MLDRLEELLRRARARGAVEADAFMVEEEVQTVQVRMGQVEALKHARENRCSLRIFTPTGSASATSSDLSAAALERLVDETVALARVTQRDEHSGLPAPEALARDVPDLDLWDREGHTLPVEARVEWARRAEAAAMEADPRILNSEGSEFYDRQGRVAYGSSAGFAGRFHVSAFALSVTPIAVENGRMERDYWYSAARKLTLLESPETVGREAARRACRRLGARKQATAEVPVVFDPESAASLVRALAIAASGPSLYRGTSFLVGRLGERLAPAAVTIVDDPLMPGGLGSRPFDGEGLPSHRTSLVDRGVLASYLLDTYSARKLGLAATGHAARESGGGVTVGYTNLYLAPGPYAPEEIIRSVERGLYATELIGFGINFATGDYSRGAVGHWIENGKLTYPVEEITIAGNLLEMCQRIEMIGRDLVFRDQTAAPTLKIGRMTVAGQ